MTRWTLTLSLALLLTACNEAESPATAEAIESCATTEDTESSAATEDVTPPATTEVSETCAPTEVVAPLAATEGIVCPQVNGSQGDCDAAVDVGTCPAAIARLTTNVPVKQLLKELQALGVTDVEQLWRSDISSTYLLHVVNGVNTERLWRTINSARAQLQSFGVIYIEPNYRVTIHQRPNDKGFNFGYDGRARQVGLDQVKAGAAWDRLLLLKTRNPSVTRSEVKVAVIDTGVKVDHEDLTTRMWRDPGKNPPDDAGMNFAAKPSTLDPSPTGGARHGTEVAGLVSAEGDNNKGVVGVAWPADVKIMAVKAMDDQGGCTDDVAAAIRYAGQKGAQVLNLSWSTCACNRTLSEALQELAEKSPNTLVVAAMGGDEKQDIDGPGNSPRDYPSSFRLPNVLSVHGTMTSGGKELMNPTYFGARSVHIAAPSMNILSTGLPGITSGACAKDTSDKEDFYCYDDGTSFAAPLVAGTAGIIKWLAPQWGYTEIKQYLIDSARKQTLDDPPKNTQEFKCKSVSEGILDVDAATAPPVRIAVPCSVERGSKATIKWKRVFASNLCATLEVRWWANHGLALLPGAASTVTITNDQSGTFTVDAPDVAATDVQIEIKCQGTDLFRLSETKIQIL